MNSSVAPLPKLANPWRSAWSLMFRREAYLDQGLAHELAVNLKSADFAAAYKLGSYPNDGWQIEARDRIHEHAAHLRSGLLASLVITTAFLVAGIVIAAVAGKFSVGMPFALGKVLSTVGGGLAAWATLFELGGYAATFSGEALHEVVRPVLFKCMFLPGLAIAAAGQVW